MIGERQLNALATPRYILKNVEINLRGLKVIRQRTVGVLSPILFCVVMSIMLHCFKRAEVLSC